MIHIPKDIADRIEAMPGGWQLTVQSPEANAGLWTMRISSCCVLSREASDALRPLLAWLEENHDDINWQGRYHLGAYRLAGIEAVVPDNWHQLPNRHDKCAHGVVTAPTSGGSRWNESWPDNEGP